MKVICNRAALLEAVTIAQSVVPVRSPKPVLSCVKLTVGDDKLTIAGTDLEVAVKFVDAQVQVEVPGETLVPADKLRDIVRESLDDTLALSVEGSEMHVRGADSHFKIFTQSASEFPPIPEPSGDADLEIAAGTLKQLIGQTIFATAKEGTRYAFNGVLFTVDKQQITLVATDGRRLALGRGDLVSVAKGKDKPKSIIPAKSLSLVDKLLSDAEQTVSITLTENQATFSTPDATLTTNLLEGVFPAYEEVIPKDTDKKMTAGTADFLSAVRRAALLTSDDNKGVRMEFSKASGLVLTSRNPESGEARVDFRSKYDGADLAIGFNPTFLGDALKVVDTDEVTFELTAPNRPGLLKAGANFVYVIMPVNLQ
ncbi:MAG: DNA polymerase III subunit beta [Tepidisphaeraceae bacterium]